ncbi:MAG: hypothetical protein CO125_01425 [Hydrogenophilales bacterium CG_4_9_14_3_um_filter_59_35]|nr:MAG: hypothetical protein COW70_01965 [Hydrogenophilales bacterium CG18_big_fil_WC_8_21_14_2_50_58_12]PIY00141.1 MAG: hypothetical protein COZ23_08930 [Hydrogenophilales bacterium CG_4_10_14_3_um_filter_58_23]PJB08557.1 MAG: hypothetical protein CO125_01425 [Hydrogenophilales bacterium CG_4_9_14_3_um_filter_59_35]
MIQQERAMTTTRQEQLFNELKMALAVTRQEDLNAWGKRSAAQLPKIASRRIRNLGALLSILASFTGKELLNSIRAMGEGRLGKHFGNRTAAAIDGSIDIANRVKSTVSAIADTLYSDPKSNASGVLALAMGFLAGSGGLDANGGIPDSDLALGIGWHRSPFTHSIIAGTVVEGAILALADLTGVIHDKLPPRHDPFWDKLLAAKDSIAIRLAQGASAGIAYHLGVDATLQPGVYHDLPVSMPLEAHQTLFAMNAVAEGIDVAHKKTGSFRKSCCRLIRRITLWGFQAYR